MKSRANSTDTKLKEACERRGLLPGSLMVSKKYPQARKAQKRLRLLMEQDSL